MNDIQSTIDFELHPSKATGGNWEAQKIVDQMDVEATTVVALRYHENDQWLVISDAERHGDAEETARLIAAAPEMMRALKQIREMAKPSGSYIVRQIDRIASIGLRKLKK